MEPTASSTALFAWAASKVVQAIGGLIGGLAMAAFWTPDKLREKGRIAAIFIAGGVSMAASLIGGGLIAHFLGIDPHDFEIAFLISMGVGTFGVAGYNWVANYIEKRQHWDIGQVAVDVRRQSANVRAKPTKKPAAPRKPAAKKTTRKTAK